MGAEQAAAGRVGGQENGAKDRTIRAGQCKVVGDGVGRRQQRQSGESGSELGTASAMLAEAEELLREGRAEDALPVALRALDTLRGAAGQNNPTTAALPALNALAEIYLELGDAATARDYFLQAVTLDPDGQIPATQGGGADKFLWLAQLSDEGGRDSVRWFERGAAILRRELTDDGPSSKPQQQQQLQHQQQEQEEETRTKLAGALCGMIEVCMTDLSWDPTAESTCERLISEALLIAPQSHSAEPLQTLASIRISQSRIPEARKALRDSLAVWGGGGGGLEPSDDDDEDDAMRVPDFPTRISLARLLMEVGMEEEALGVVERLVREDDGSVEAWYLGGWCLYLLGVKRGGPRRKHTSMSTNAGDIVNGAHDHDHDHDHGHKAKAKAESESEENEENEEENNLSTPSLSSSREWLRQSLTLYQIVEYEDERLKEHAEELVREIDGIIGEDEKGEDEDEEDGEWNGFGEDSGEEQEVVEEEDEDEEMGDG